MTKKKIIGLSVVTRRGQITIPKGLREEFSIKEGDTVFFLVEENKEKKIVIAKGPITLE